jgi:hypothetical protein
LLQAISFFSNFRQIPEVRVPEQTFQSGSFFHGHKPGSDPDQSQVFSGQWISSPSLVFAGQIRKGPTGHLTDIVIYVGWIKCRNGVCGQICKEKYEGRNAILIPESSGGAISG